VQLSALILLLKFGEKKNKLKTQNAKFKIMVYDS